MIICTIEGRFDDNEYQQTNINAVEGKFIFNSVVQLSRKKY